MAKTIIKLSGTLKVGLGSSPSGKILDRDTKCVHFYCKDNTEEEQIKKLRTALRWHKENGKRMFYSHNSRAYQEVTEEWINKRINILSH